MMGKTFGTLGLLPLVAGLALIAEGLNYIDPHAASLLAGVLLGLYGLSKIIYLFSRESDYGPGCSGACGCGSGCSGSCGGKSGCECTGNCGCTGACAHESCAACGSAPCTCEGSENTCDCNEKDCMVCNPGKAKKK